MFTVIFSVVSFVFIYRAFMSLGWAELYPEDMSVISIFAGVISSIVAYCAGSAGYEIDANIKKNYQEYQKEKRREAENRENLAKQKAGRKREEERLAKVNTLMNFASQTARYSLKESLK